jgi:hypothetical protein
MAAFEEPELCWLITLENEDNAMAESHYTLPRIRVELALSAFLSSLSEESDIAENETRSSQYQDRVATTLDELNKATYDLLNPNLYRITARDREGKISTRETKASSLYLAVQGQDMNSEVVKVERIHPITGRVLGGFYNE